MRKENSKGSGIAHRHQLKICPKIKLKVNNDEERSLPGVIETEQ
jgi:hypothetical protein